MKEYCEVHYDTHFRPPPDWPGWQGLTGQLNEKAQEGWRVIAHTPGDYTAARCEHYIPDVFVLEREVPAP